MADNLGIEMQAKLDTTKAKAQADNFKKETESKPITIPTDIDTNKLEEVKRKVKTLIDEEGKLYTQSELVKKSSKEIISATSFTTATKEVKKYKDEMGNLVTQTKELNKYGEQITTTTIAYKDGLGKTVKETEVYNETLKQMVSTYKEVNEDAEKMAEAERKAKEEAEKLAEAEKQTQQAVSQTGNEMANQEKKAFSLGQSFTDMIRKLSAYYLASLPIRAVTKAFEEAITVVTEFDSALTEFKKVSDLSGDSLREYTEQLGQLGQTVGRTRTEMVQAATEFKKSGFSDEDSSQLALVATMYQNIADEEISAGESASFIISQMKAFNIEADNAIHIIDAVNEVSSNTAVSSADLATNLGKVSATLSANGVAFEEQLGMLTGITEITRNASTASRGLIQISSRLVQTLDESSSTGKKLIDIYGDLGIALKDEVTGQLRSTYDILSDLSERWDGLSKNQRDYIALTSAGANQVRNFNALMKNFGQVQYATALAYSSNNSAMKENEKYMESIEAKTKALKAEFERLILGQGGLESFAKSLLNVSTGIIKLVNSLGGLKTIIVAVIGILATSNYAKIGTFISKIGDKIVSLLTVFGTLKNSLVDVSLGTQTLGGAMATLGETVNLTKLAVGGFFALLTGGVVIFHKIKEAIEAKEKALENSIKSYEEAQQEAEGLESELESLQNQIKAIQDAKVNITDEKQLAMLDAQLSNLQLQEATLKNQVALAKQKAQIEGQKSKTEAYSKLEESSSSLIFDENANAKSFSFDNRRQALEQYTAEYERLKQVALETEQALAEAMAEGSNATDNEIYELQAKSAGIKTAMEDIIALGSEQAQAIGMSTEAIANNIDTQTAQGEIDRMTIDNNNQLVDSWLRVTGVITEENDAVEEYVPTLEELAEQYELTGEQIEIITQLMEEQGLTTTEAYAQMIESQEEAQESLDSVVESYQNAVTALNDMDSAFSTLSDAMNEYNSSGEFTMSTLNNLLSLGSEYLSLLQFENGQLSLNQDGMMALANARIDEAEAMAYNQAIAQLDALAHDQLADSVGQSGSATYKASGDIQSTIPALDQCIAKCNQASNAWNQLWASMSKFSFSGKNISGAQNNIIGGLKNTITALEGARSSLGKYTSALAGGGGGSSRGGGGGGGGGGATKAVDEHTEALKEQKKALEELIKQYETVIKYIKSKVKDQISELKDLRDSAVDAVEEQIRVLKEQEKAEVEALQKQKNELKEKQEQEEDYWDKKIEAFKAQNDAIEEQIELERLQEQLAKAKTQKVMVFKDGKFQWDTDQSAVDKAQKELDEYKRKQAYEKQLQELENFKQKAKENYEAQIKDLDNKIDATEQRYEKQIEDLEALSEEIKNDYNQQIKYYEEWEKKFEKQVGAYEEEQNRLLALQLTGIDFENKNWTTRLSNLDTFVANYKKKQEELAKITAQINASASSATGGGGGGGGGGYGGGGFGGGDATEPSNYKVYQVLGRYKNYQEAGRNVGRLGGNGVTTHQGEYVVYKQIVGGLTLKQANTEMSRLSQSAHGAVRYVVTDHYASGASSIKDDEFAVVGENPNKEIVLGAKLNNGVGMKLSKGSGVVNAESTKTLAGIINKLGSGLTPNNYQLRDTMGDSVTQTFKFDNLVLPNVNNAETFVKALSDKFQNYSIQYCNKH